MSDRLEDIIEFRKKKLERIQQAGMEPYPSTTARTHTNKQVLDQFDQLQGKSITLVGRMRGMRAMGKLIFCHIEDGTARIQVLLKADEVGQDKFKFFQENFDIGDFIETTGTLFTTKSGEKTLQVSSYKILAKALLPLPSEHYGLEDQEIRLRKRYLDILLNPEIKELFQKKNRFWSSMREFMVRQEFMEVEMPVLEAVPGGAEAEPFVTHHNALNRDLFLRISLELPLKKMLVAGYEKVFEMGRIFRNEGVSTEHLQDYMQMEFYWAYGDFEKLMKFLQDMYQYVIQQTFGTLKLTSNGMTVDWSGEWGRVDYVQLFKERTGLDVLSCSDDELSAYADSKKVSYEDFAQRGRLIDLIYKKIIRPTLNFDKPAFIINQPVELEPLAKRDPKNPKIVQRLQILAYGTELGKGFGELNDPLDQRQRFDEQMKLREAGDPEAQMIDEDYVEAMEYGMPPAAGFGISERLFAVLADKSIRETVIFPQMKDVGGANIAGKAKEAKMAIAVINAGIKLEPWQELNTVAHLSAALGARQGRQLLYQEDMATKDGQSIVLNIQHAIMIKTAPTIEALRHLAGEAKNKHLQVTEFTRDMIESTSDKKVIEWTKAKPHKDIEYFGVLVFGDRILVESLTKDFPLYDGRAAATPTSPPSEFHESKSGRIPFRQDALALLHKEVKTENLIKHMLATEAFMRSLARKFGQDENKWGIAGLLHDLDWDQTKDNPEQHSLVAYKMLTELGIDSEIAEAVKIHNDRHGFEPKTSLDKALYCGEVMTGFITACALVQPDKKLSSVTVESALKKFKNKSFAAGADREIMKKCEPLLGIPLEEMIALCLGAMQGIDKELGL